MSVNLTGTYSSYSLTNALTQNPATIAVTGVIDGELGAGSSTPWTIVNYGAVGNTKVGFGIALGAGDVINNSSGSIESDDYGIRFVGGPGYLTNFGSIMGNISDWLNGASGTISNYGTIASSSAEFMLCNAVDGGLVIGTVSNDGVTYAAVGGVGSEWNFHAGNVATVT